jgi:hypothetical protein
MKQIACQLAASTLTLALVSALPAADCDQTSVGMMPLMDLGTKTYQGEVGGLYAGGTNVPPADHLDAGLLIVQSLKPLAPDGTVDEENGVILLVSVGMSNTSQEFNRFRQLVGELDGLHPKLAVINGAQGGKDVTHTADPNNSFWDVLNQRLAQGGYTPQQVQIVWLKQAKAQPSGPFHQSAGQLKSWLADSVRNVKHHLPNAALCYLSSRIYAGYATTTLNPEPYAYESGFAVKWLIADQIAGDPQLNFDPNVGEVMAPWLAWGPYLWADGLTPRSDGLIWECGDLAADGTHPSESGRTKVANLLIDFFSSDPTATPWFLAESPANPADLNGDGVVNVADLLILFDHWGQCADCLDCPADFNNDCVVNVADLLFMFDNWG